MNSSHFFAIVLVNYNSLDHLKVCLESLKNQTFANFQTIVVDNNSQDESVTWIQKNHPEIKLVCSSENLGFAGGNNLAKPYVDAEYVFFLNNDTTFAKDMLAILHSEILENSNYQAFAPMLVQSRDPQKCDSGGDYLSLWGFSSTLEGLATNLPIFDQNREVMSACGAAAVYKSSLLEKIGWFDKDFFLIYEDMDLSLRAWKSGSPILYLPQVKIQHHRTVTIGKHSPIELFYATRNLLAAKVRNYPIWLFLLQFIPSVFTALFLGAKSIPKKLFFIWLKARMQQFPLALKAIKKRFQDGKSQKVPWLKLMKKHP